MKRGRPTTRGAAPAPKPGIKNTIAALRKCNAAQAGVISHLEAYQRAMAGIGFKENRGHSSSRNGYDVEVAYLRWRGEALTELIAAFEAYKRVAQNSLGLAELLMRQ